VRRIILPDMRITSSKMALSPASES